MSKKLTIEFIKRSFEKEGYKLLSKEYKNNKSDLEFICVGGHYNTISWISWQQGHRCSVCSANKKANLEVARKVFESEGYVLLSNRYKNARTPLKYICNNGHEHKSTLDNFKRGYRCPYCNGRPIINIEDVRKLFNNYGYTLLSKNYINAKQKLKYSCPEGHIGFICLSSFKAGNRCPICNFVNHSGPKHWNWLGGTSCEPYCSIWSDKDYKESIKQRDGYRCLNPYCNKKDKRLHIHHIDYNKKNCGPQNLITLCGSCNIRANYDREWHTMWYRTILNKRYSYKY